MKKTTLFIAPPGARNKKESIFKEIVSLHPENDYSSVLYLGPNNFVLAAARSRFFNYLKKTHNKSAYIPFQSLTIKQLASNLHDTYGTDNVISDRVRTLILCVLLRDKNIGYACLLSDLLKKIRHYLLDKDLTRLKDEIKSLIFEEKAADRAVKAIEILESYEDKLKKKNIIDQEGMLKNSICLIKQHLNQNKEHRTQNTDKGKSIPLLNIETLVIDGFFDPTPLELEIIKALIDKTEKVYLLVEENTGILKYFQSDKTGMATKKLKSTAYRKNAGYYTYPSMEEEVEGIARNVKKLILDGVKPWEITVCFPVLLKYIHMLRRVFKKYGVPVSIEEYNLSTTQPFIALEEMIVCIEEDYPRNDFLSFLTSPYFPAIPDLIKERAVSYSYRAGIVKGKNSWLSIKEILLNSSKNNVPEDNKGLLDEFQKGIKLIMDTFENIKQKKDIISFIDDFESALNKFGFFDSPDITGSPRFGDEILNKITRKFFELRNFAGLYESGQDSFNRPVFYLKHLLQDLKGMDKNRDGVKIVPFELAAGLETKVLFFGGMLEGDFPSRPDIDPILPEKVKKALGMPYLEYYLNRQKLYFKKLLNVSVIDPFFSCPSADGDKIFLPSPFLDWAKSIKPLELNIFTEEEVLIREGAVKQTRAASKIFRDGETFFSREAHTVLRRRIGAVSKGFFSVTDIDYYRKCPLRFYIEKVLCLEMERPPKFEVEARLWGTLAHKTMEYLFKSGEIELDAIDEKIFEGLEKSLKQFPVGDFWSRVAREIFQRLLPLIKEQENNIRMQGFSPCMVEKNIKAEIDGLKLKGKIDRVDSATRNLVTLLDYKTGAADSDSLQLPLYAGMWQNSFSEPVAKVGYYSLKEGRVYWYPKKTGMEEFIQNAMHKAEALVKGIKSGMFPAEPVKDIECRYCCHSPLCKGRT